MSKDYYIARIIAQSDGNYTQFVISFFTQDDPCVAAQYHTKDIMDVVMVAKHSARYVQVTANNDRKSYIPMIRDVVRMYNDAKKGI